MSPSGRRVAGDTQVKIRGLRIELGDIESNIVSASDGALREAVVTLRDGDPQFLVAHVVFAPQHNIVDTEAFLQHLLNHLQVPQYMIPVMAIPLDRMPLSNHSKVDRKALKALPLPQCTNSSEDSEELTETMIQLRRVWEDILSTKELGLSITHSTSFFTIGGNSLLVVRLQSRIRDVFNVTVRLYDILEVGLRKITSWTLLMSELAASCIRMCFPRNPPAPVISTTFVSRLERLAIDRSSKSYIRQRDFLVPINQVNTGALFNLLRHLTKCVGLGLSESDFWALAGEVDSILHMAAVRSFGDNYHFLRPSNVTPTKQLIKMAAARRIPINYTSTAGIVPRESAGSVAASAAEHPPATDGSNGYIATRWACEQVLERAASTLGIRASIHRFVPAKAPSVGSTVPALEHFVRFVDEISMMPKFIGTKGHFEMTPVDEAAGRLAEALIGEPANETGTARFLHHDCEVRIDISEMMAFLEVRRGKKGFETMSGMRFIRRMKELGLQYFVASQVFLMESTTKEGKMEVLESRR